MHPLGYPCQAPAAPLGTEYVAQSCTVCKDWEADEQGPWNGPGSVSLSLTPHCITLGMIQYKIALKTAVFLFHLHTAKEKD